MFTGEFSGLFAPMWQCPVHGDTWKIEEVIEGDEALHLCQICHQSVTPYYLGGQRVWHPLTDEEAYWEQMSADDPFETDSEDDWFGG